MYSNHNPQSIVTYEVRINCRGIFKDGKFEYGVVILALSKQNYSQLFTLAERLPTIFCFTDTIVQAYHTIHNLIIPIPLK